MFGALANSARVFTRNRPGESPSAKHTASNRFDLPAPFAPAMHVKPAGRGTVARLLKDLKPSMVMEMSRTDKRSAEEFVEEVAIELGSSSRNRTPDAPRQQY